METVSRPRSTAVTVALGFVSGVLVALPALMLAVISGGAGHGDYVAARWLFPAPCLVTLLEDNRFGAFSIGVGLLQFPNYGAILGWSIARKNYLPAVVLVAAHIIAAVFCFSGILPN